MRHLIKVVQDLGRRSIGFNVLAGHGASIDRTTSAGMLVFGIFASLAEFERDPISERTKAELASARARGRKAVRRSRCAWLWRAMGQKETKVTDFYYPADALSARSAGWHAT
jgi:DNA invertase Pin-like site-specific DNA recombinase